MKIVFPRRLPGKSAHLKLAPEHRVISLIKEQAPPAIARESAVLILLLDPENGRTIDIGGKRVPDWDILFIKRNTYDGVHSGQVAFPGGKCDEEDADYLATACREIFEELGIERDRYEIAGQLTKLYVPPSNFTIYPFVAFAKGSVDIIPDPREVSNYYLFPLSMFNGSNIFNCKVKAGSYEHVDAPGYWIDGEIIWGATAMIVTELYEILTSISSYRWR